jgi:hypothetical protein
MMNSKNKKSGYLFPIGVLRRDGLLGKGIGSSNATSFVRRWSSCGHQFPN